MKKTFLRLPVVIFVLLSVVSCNKNGSSTSKIELLTQKAWLYQNLEVGAGGAWQTDPSFATMEVCEKDNQTVFKATKAYEVNEGATKCDSSDPQVNEQGTWDFADNETKLIISGETATINQLDEKTLILTGTTTVENSTINYRVTFKH